MIALYVFGALLCLLLLPFSARFSFCGEARLVVRYAGLPIFRYNSAAQKKPKAEPQKESSKAQKDDSYLKTMTARLKQEGAVAVVTYLVEFGRFLGKTSRRLLRAIHFGRCTVRVTVGGGDAAATALKYGGLCGPLASAAALLRERLRARRFAVTVTPDFLAGEDTVEADVRAVALPVSLLWAAVCTLFSHIAMTLRLSKEREE